MQFRVLGALFCVVATGSSFAENRAHAASESDASAHCKALLEVDFSSIADAPTRIVEALPTQAVDARPAICQVSGYVAPGLGFTLGLPVTWNGKFLQLGCGGFCGSANLMDCDQPLRHGYACIVSDNGHRSSGRDALWAFGNLQAEVDHAYRGVHVTALAGKAIVERHYGHAPRNSYFMGSSTGGRQALLAAQRFPWDFDGIIAGVPSLSVTGIHMNLLWGNRAFTSGDGAPLLTPTDLHILHKAVLAKCDMNDGLRDGLIGDPRVCAFDPREIACSDARKRACLTARQIEAVNKIYGGAVTSQGKPIYMPGALKGSEKTWMDWFVSRAPANAPRATYNFVREEFRYAAFDPDPGPAWQPEGFDFDRDYKRLGVADALADAVNPDLRKFKAAGGKLLVYAGWSDAAGMPLHAVDYYETVERVAGGRAATQDFFRLFVIPGMEHAYGDGAFAVDWLSYLEAWVEHQRPPDELVSFHVKLDDLNLNDAGDRRELARRTTYPLNPNTIEFSRPVYPYPTTVRYSGYGDARDSASFGPAEPKVAAAAMSSSTALRE